MLVDEKMQGHGSMKYENGESYVGNWVNSMRHTDESPATFTTAAGVVYTGNWKEDKRVGIHSKNIDGNIFNVYDKDGQDEVV